MPSRIFGEFMGTFVMILLGDGVVAGVLLKRSKAEGGGWLVITTGWAFAVMAGIFTAVACGSPDAHLNPAITVAFAIQSGSFAKVIPYAAAQLGGAIAGATLVWLHFLPHWRETPDPDIKRACFCTSPAIRSTANNVTSEIIATFALVFVVGAFSSKGVAALIPIGPLGPYLVSCLVWESACPWEEPPATPLILHETWVLVLRTRFSLFLTRVTRIGHTPLFR